MQLFFVTCDTEGDPLRPTALNQRQAETVQRQRMSLSGCIETSSPGPIRAHGQPVTTKPASWRQGPASHLQLAVGAGEGRTQTMVLPTLSGCKPSRALRPRYRLPPVTLVKAKTRG